MNLPKTILTLTVNGRIHTQEEVTFYILPQRLTTMKAVAAGYPEGTCEIYYTKMSRMKKKSKNIKKPVIITDETKSFIKSNHMEMTVSELSMATGLAEVKIEQYMWRNELQKKRATVYRKGNWRTDPPQKDAPKKTIDRAAFTKYSNKRFVA